MKHAKIYILRTFLIMFKSNVDKHGRNVLEFLENMKKSNELTLAETHYIAGSLELIFNCDCILTDDLNEEDVYFQIQDKIYEIETN